MTVSHLFVVGTPNVRRAVAVGLTISLAALAGGCANDSSNIFTTGSLAGSAPVAVPATPDPVCMNLSSQIETIKKEGTVERLEKAADGKTAAVKVQRTALVKQTQLNKLNADFIAKCGPAIPKSATTTAAAPAQPAPVAAKTASAAPAKPVAAKDSGVTVAPPTGVQN